MKLKPIFGLILILALALASCQTPTAAPTQAQMANPASENCIAQGGTLEMATRGDGGEYGVCYFEDNRQCEEWALYHGDCPVGGLKVTGYITPAAQYCAITAGTYTITGESNTDTEQGTCTLKDGAVCDVWDYYNGKCSAGQATTPTSVAQAATPTSATQTESAGAISDEMIPLKDALATLQPQDVFQNFYEITQIPRPSGYMDQIREFLVNFGQGLGLETIVDEAGNLIIRKPASAGLEDRPGIILQAHMDMVPRVYDDKDFDFTTDPIEAFVSGDYIVTDGTTLGADDGIGVAMIMAVLQSSTLKTGPIEALFTVDEETTMSGANGLNPETLKGRTLINLDSETLGVFTIGSAGGEHVNINAAYTQAPAPSDLVSYLVEVTGLQGGHSGVEINLGRGSATKLLVRLLKETAGIYGLRIASLTGGTVANAIPSEAEALVFLPNNQVEAFTQAVKDFETTVKSELAATEPEMSIQVQAVQPPAQVMDEVFQNTLIDALYGTPQNVIRMSDTVPDLVETSTNIGVTTVQDGQIQIVNYPRSSVNSELVDIAQMISSVWELAGYQAEITDAFSAWTPNPESPIVELMEAAYVDLFAAEPEISAVHAGLECGAIGGIYPDMDMISVGPTMNAVHTVSERLYIPSVEGMMNLLLEVLQRFPGE